MANDTYEPEVVQENPFPNELVSPTGQISRGTGDTFTPATSKEKMFPKKRTAVELLSTALNTRSRKVLQEFELEQSGGFQIGKFEEGLTGDVRITPNGLTGRNVAGITTFALDTDGNLVLVGELRSGSLITGSVVVTDGDISLYNDGVLEIFIGDDGT